MTDIKKIEKIQAVLSAALVEKFLAYPIDECADNRDIWRRDFDRLQMDLERLRFAKKVAASLIPPRLTTVETGFY